MYSFVKYLCRLNCECPAQIRVILKCEKDSFLQKGLLFLRKGLTLSVIGVKYGDNFTISILKIAFNGTVNQNHFNLFLFIVT